MTGTTAAVFEPRSYGFRPGRGCHDAIKAIHQAGKGRSAKRLWVLDADLEAAFDRLSHEFGLGYAIGVSHTYTVTDGAGRRWKARQMINKVLPHQWMRMQTGHGTKGTREYDWAWLDVRADDTPDGHGDDGTSVLVARRHRYTGELSFFRCWSTEDVTLAQLVNVICRRWRIEETFQLGKTFTGLDEGQVTCWNSWMRWSLFSLAASAVLALTAAAATTEGPARPARLVPLTCPELVRLLRAFVLTPPVRDAEHILHWMAWRRHHQAIAQACHQRRHALHDQP